MNVVTQWVTGVVLHVANQNIMPVNDVQRAVRSKFHVNGSEISIFAHKQIHAVLAFKTRTVVLQSMLFHPQKSNRIVD